MRRSHRPFSAVIVKSPDETHSVVQAELISEIDGSREMRAVADDRKLRAG